MQPVPLVPLTVRDLQQSDVVSVSPNTPLLQVHRLFVEAEIHGAPVLEDDGSLVGVITTTDLVRAIEEEHESGIVQTDYFRDILPYSVPDWAGGPEDLQDRLEQSQVEDAMTREVATISPDAPVGEAARLLRENKIHRLFVTEGGVLVGVISAFDLLAIVEKSA